MKNTLPKRSVFAPACLYAMIGIMVSFIVFKLGFYKNGDERLLQFVTDRISLGGTLTILPNGILLLVSVLICIGLAFAVLDSASLWKKLVLCCVTLLLVVTAVPTLAVCGFYFSPFLLIVALFWSSFCAIMYSEKEVVSPELIAQAFAKKGGV